MRKAVFVIGIMMLAHGTAAFAIDVDLGNALSEKSLKPQGWYYKATVPATLDLAERCRLSVHGTTSFLNPHATKPVADYGPYGHAWFNVRRPYMTSMVTGLPNWGSLLEGMIMSRAASGSRKNLDIEAKSLAGMVQYFFVGPHYTAAVGPGPWTRAMLALMALYQVDPNPGIRQLLDQIAEHFYACARHKGDEAFYVDETTMKRLHIRINDGRGGYQGPLPLVFPNALVLRCMVRWAALSGDPRAMGLAGELAHFLVRPELWTPEVTPKLVVAAEHAQFRGSQHSWLQTILALLYYAQATNNSRLKQFVRDGYEYQRTYGIARIGLFGESCTTADMTMLAIMMSDMGIGDYWEDVDQYVRNQLTEMQITDAAKLRRTVAAMPLNADHNGRGIGDPLYKTNTAFDPENETTRAFVERNLGNDVSDATHPSTIPEQCSLWVVCCQCNPVVARYCAWESIVRCKGGAAQINLLLNRASPWLDIDSYLPYDGKVVIRNKTAHKLAVRIPDWVDKRALRAAINGRSAPAYWVGRYLVFDKLAARDVLTIAFPMVETMETYTLKLRQEDFWKECSSPETRWKPAGPPVRYTCQFRGNTLVDISPRFTSPGYAMYQRDYLNRDRAPMMKVMRYIPAVIMQWER